MKRLTALITVVATCLMACTSLDVPAATTSSPLGATLAPTAVPQTPGASVPVATSASLPPVTAVPQTEEPATPSPTPPESQRPRRSKSPKPPVVATATPTASPTAAPTPTPTPAPAQPDLIVKSFTIPVSVTHDQEASGAMYVHNSGPGDAGPFEVAIYGSCPGESLSQAPKPVSGLAAGADKFISVKFTFSNTGSCTVSAEIDSADQVSESNEGNNDVSASVTSQ